MKTIRKRILFQGRVQGVGFRFKSMHYASKRGLTGWVRNQEDGSVIMEVQGIQNDILLFLDDLNDDLYIRIEQIREKEIPLVDEIGFQMKY